MTNKQQSKGLVLWLCALLIALNAVIFGRACFYSWTDYDDNGYVFENPDVQGGLTTHGVAAAFLRPHAASWFPLAMLSHMLDVEVFGLEHPGGHHFTSLAFHIANTLVLFFLLMRLTRSGPVAERSVVWRSAAVAAFFAIHPFHVEPVVWISSRKDVLSTLLWLLAIWAYAQYVEQPKTRRYALVLALFGLALFAKTVAVTLPVVLLLLDYWPLRRTGPQAPPNTRRSWQRLLLEKTPMFFLAGLFSLAEFLIQRSLKALDVERYAMGERLANAAVTTVAYLGKTLWPTRLAIHYPHPASGFAAWQVLGALALLALVTACAYRVRKQHPCIIVGWLWYLFTLAPVSGLIPIGGHVAADRYTYVPLIGLFVAAVWGVPVLAARRPKPRPQGTEVPIASKTMAAAAVFLLSAWSVCAWVQVGYWRDNVALFAHAVEVTTDNGKMHISLGQALAARGDDDAAAEHFNAALQINTNYADAHTHLGLLWFRRGDVNQAMTHFREALRIEPKDPNLYVNLGNALASQGELEDAARLYSAAIEIDPRCILAHGNLGMALDDLGDLNGAETHLRTAVELTPNNADAHCNLGAVLLKQGKLREALGEFSAALNIDPSHPNARKGLERAQDQSRANPV